MRVKLIQERHFLRIKKSTPHDAGGFGDEGNIGVLGKGVLGGLGKLYIMLIYTIYIYIYIHMLNVYLCPLPLCQLNFSRNYKTNVFEVVQGRSGHQLGRPPVHWRSEK